MKRFDLVKTIQLIMLIVITVTALVLILRDPDLYALIATDRTAKTISVILWVTLGVSFLFLLYDFNSYADMRRENLELDNSVYSDALTGMANRYYTDIQVETLLFRHSLPSCRRRQRATVSSAVTEAINLLLYSETVLTRV